MLSVINKLFYLSGDFCIFADKSLRRMVRMTQPTILPVTLLIVYCLQCFDAVGWAAGRASGL